MDRKIVHLNSFRLRQWQHDVFLNDARNIIGRLGRRAGKTMLGVMWILNHVIKTGTDAVVLSMNNENLKKVHLRYFEAALRELILLGVVKMTTSPSSMEFSFAQGGKITLCSAESAYNLLGTGRNVKRIWCDEIARWSADSRKILGHVLGFTFLGVENRDTRLLITSTPEYWPTYFEELIELCHDEDNPEYYEYYGSSRVSPLVTETEIRNMCANKEPIEVLVEIEAQSPTGEQSVFPGYLDENVSADYKYNACSVEPNGRYLISADIAKVHDYTVIFVWDSKSRPMRAVYFERFKQKSYDIVEDILVALSQKWNGASLVLDSTKEETLVDNLKRRGRIVKGLHWGGGLKNKMVNNLKSMIGKKDIMFSKWDHITMKEMAVYSEVRTTGAQPKYSAPGGLHDDCVASMMMGAWMCRKNRYSNVPINIAGSEPRYDVLGKRTPTTSELIETRSGSGMEKVLKDFYGKKRF